MGGGGGIRGIDPQRFNFLSSQHQRRGNRISNIVEKILDSIGVYVETEFGIAETWEKKSEEEQTTGGGDLCDSKPEQSSVLILGFVAVGNCGEKKKSPFMMNQRQLEIHSCVCVKGRKEERKRGSEQRTTKTEMIDGKKDPSFHFRWKCGDLSLYQPSSMVQF